MIISTKVRAQRIANYEEFQRVEAELEREKPHTEFTPASWKWSCPKCGRENTSFGGFYPPDEVSCECGQIVRPDERDF